MVPLSRDLRACSHCQDSLRDRLVIGIDAAVANDVVRGNIGDGLEKRMSIQNGSNCIKIAILTPS